MATVKWVPPIPTKQPKTKILSDKTRELKRFIQQTFEIRENGNVKRRHTLLFNPQEMSIDEPNRSNPVQTLGGAYIQDFGAGLRVINISGVTGYRLRKNRDGVERDGFQEFKALRDDVYRYFINNLNKDMAMYWFNWEDDDFYQVIPTNFRLQRSRSEPLLYRYDITMTIIADARNLKKHRYPEPVKIQPLGSGILSGIGSSLNETLGKFRK